MGLQFSQECFCGDTYFTADQDPIPTDACFMPCSGDEALVCGGPWANSVYIVGEPAEMTEEEQEVLPILYWKYIRCMYIIHTVYTSKYL